MDTGSHDVQGSSAVLSGVHQNSLEKSRSSVVWSVVETVIVEAAIRKSEDLKALSSELGSNKAVDEAGLEELKNEEGCVHRDTSEVSSHVELGIHKNSNNSADGNVSETVVVIDSGDGSCGGDNGKLVAKVHDLGSSNVEESKMKVAEGEKDSHVIDIKCKSGKGFSNNWEAESVCRICHLSSDQSPDRKLETTSFSASMDLIRLGCECKDELGIAHTHCAEAWFRLKGNRICEICGETAKNITGLGDNRFLEEWNERRLADLGRNTSERHVGCWRGQPFCNFLMACLVVSFVLPWFFYNRVNMF